MIWSGNDKSSMSRDLLKDPLGLNVGVLDNTLREPAKVQNGIKLYSLVLTSQLG